MSVNPDVSVVVVARNARDDVLRCLRSLEDHAETTCEAVVVDDPESGDPGEDFDDSVEPQVSWAATYASQYSFQGFDRSNSHRASRLAPRATADC